MRAFIEILIPYVVLALASGAVVWVTYQGGL